MKSLCIFLATASFISTGALTSGCTDNKTKAGHDASAAMTVDVAKPTIDSIVIRTDFPATMSANKSVDAVARVNGYVTAQYFNGGDYVKRGQALFKIEDTQYRDAVSQAEAALQSAISQTEYATKQYNAMKKAFESEAVSEMDVVQAENAMKAGEASIKSARSQLQTARTNLGYCTVTALSSGHISAANVDVGDYVSGSGEPVPLATIYDDKIINAKFAINDEAYFNLSELRSTDQNLFDEIPVSFSQTLQHNYYGKLSYVAPDIDKSTGTMTIKISVSNDDGELKDGMYATVALPLGHESHAMLIKDSAISSDQKGKYVYTIDKNNRIVYTPIVTGELLNDTLRVVKSGLTPDSEYVTKALLKVRNGMTVRPRMVK